MRLLCLCDSPTVETGFGRVARALLQEWQVRAVEPVFERVDIWGINFSGYPHEYPYRIYPAGYGEWATAAKLQHFLTKLRTGGYSHVWILQDLFQLSANGFPKVLREICQSQKIRSYLYFPVDAPVDAWWTEIVRAVDFPVAYTEYGKREVERWLLPQYEMQNAQCTMLNTGKGSQSSKEAESLSIEHRALSIVHCEEAPPKIGVLAGRATRARASGTAGKAAAESSSIEHRALGIEHFEKIRVIPHGVDTAVFHPFFPSPQAEREKIARQKLREKTYVPDRPGGFTVGPNDVLLLNVNTHSRRKAPVQSLEILAHLKKLRVSELRVEAEKKLRAAELRVEGRAPDSSSPPSTLNSPTLSRRWKLLMHMPNESPQEGVTLETMAEQLGLVHAEDWADSRMYFEKNHPRVTDAGLNQLYNTADLYLSTSLGEGWGLGITEALAAGLPVAVPNHTSCAEIFDNLFRMGMGNRVIPLPLSPSAVVQTMDNSRVRYPVDPVKAAEMIHAFAAKPSLAPGVPLNAAVKEWLSWKRVAAEWAELFKKG